MSKLTISKKNLSSLQNISKKFDILVETLLPLSDEYNVKTMKFIQSTLQLSFKNPLILEDMQKIEKLSPDVHSLSQRLQGFHPKFVEQILEINKVLETTFLKYRDKEDTEFDRKYEGFNKIQEKYKLCSIWSEYDIKPSDMKKPFSDKPVESLTYESWGPIQQVQHGKIATWFDMWKLADKVIRQSGDTHHMFIEGFVEDKKKPGHFKLMTGS
jgi:hypothetical protein